MFQIGNIGRAERPLRTSVYDCGYKIILLKFAWAITIKLKQGVTYTLETLYIVIGKKEGILIRIDLCNMFLCTMLKRLAFHCNVPL